jgi:hypothetical protein
MKLSREIITSVLVVLLFSGVAAKADPRSEESKRVVIPLDQVWAYQMPGTRDIAELEGTQRELLRTIFESTFRGAGNKDFKDIAQPGFVVAGSGRAALEAAHAVFVDAAKPKSEFSPNEDVSLVFFSAPLSRYRVEIQQVRRTENKIEVRYELQGSISKSSFDNLALIPLGRLPVGKYHVDSLQLPRDPTSLEVKFKFKRLDEEWGRNWLCQPFDFEVTSEHQ